MATKLWLRRTTTHGITDTGDGVVWRMDEGVETPGPGETVITTATASGTNIQCTRTAGGLTIAWISGRVPSGGFTLTSGDAGIRAIENDMAVNAGMRYRVYRYQPGPTITELGGGPFDDGVEISANSYNLMTWTGNHTDQAFVEDDRILVRFYITNVGTMGAGTVSLAVDGQAATWTADSYFNIAETVSFKAEETTLPVKGTVLNQAVSRSYNFGIRGLPLPLRRQWDRPYAY